MRRTEVRSIGPVRLKRGSAPKQTLGLVFAVIGVEIIAFAYENLLLSAPSGFVGHVLLGSFVAFNGLYLSGFRFRAWPTDDQSAG